MICQAESAATTALPGAVIFSSTEVMWAPTSSRGASPHEMKNQEQHRYHDQDVNKSCGNVSRQPKDQPQNHEDKEKDQEQKISQHASLSTPT
jgi:hypothetical protein